MDEQPVEPVVGTVGSGERDRPLPQAARTVGQRRRLVRDDGGGAHSQDGDPELLFQGSGRAGDDVDAGVSAHPPAATNAPADRGLADAAGACLRPTERPRLTLCEEGDASIECTGIHRHIMDGRCDRQGWSRRTGRSQPPMLHRPFSTRPPGGTLITGRSWVPHSRAGGMRFRIRNSSPQAPPRETNDLGEPGYRRPRDIPCPSPRPGALAGPQVSAAAGPWRCG